MLNYIVLYMQYALFWQAFIVIKANHSHRYILCAGSIKHSEKILKFELLLIMQSLYNMKVIHTSETNIIFSYYLN